MGQSEQPSPNASGPAQSGQRGPYAAMRRSLRGCAHLRDRLGGGGVRSSSRPRGSLDGRGGSGSGNHQGRSIEQAFHILYCERAFVSTVNPRSGEETSPIDV